MNYRHQFHAGNFADVLKHVLLVGLLEAMQRKEKGFLFLDTHAGRGGYDLSAALELRDGRSRPPEHPEGVGRLWGRPAAHPLIGSYLAVVRRFNERAGVVGEELHYYPGSPWFARLLARPQDRLALSELREDDAEALEHEFRREKGVRVHASDGYNALKAMLPPLERRALVLIDPPYENKSEFDDVASGLTEALRRFPAGVYALWYPLSDRVQPDGFLGAVRALGVPALLAELAVTGDPARLRMKGCGLVVLNPPWRFDADVRAVLPLLRDQLRLDDGGAARCEWLVPER